MKDSVNVVSEQRNDEIDLIEIIRVLWSKKLFIIAVTFITTVLAGIYAFTAKEQWTSKAVIVAPKVAELGTYLDVRREYNRILRVDPVDPNVLSNNLFANFNRLAQSADIRNDFFVNSDVYKSSIENKDEQAQRRILTHLSTEATTFSVPDQKKNPNAIGNTLSFSAENSVIAQDTLGEFINFVNNRALKLELDDFLVDFHNILTALKYEKSLIQEDLSVNKSVQLENLNKAYETGVKAGIKEYSKVFNESDVSSLAAAAISDTKIPLSDSKLCYYQIDFQLKQLEPLFKKAKEVTAKSYSYQASPDYPVNKDKPKKALILALGIILGVCLSIVWLILLMLFSNTRNRRTIA